MLKQYISKPDDVKAMAWLGSHDQAQEIIDYLHTKNNAHGIYTSRVSPHVSRLRILAHGMVFDMYPGQYFVHNLTKDRFYIMPGDEFEKTHRLRS